MTAPWNPWRKVIAIKISKPLQKCSLFDETSPLKPGQRGDLFLKAPAGRMLIQVVHVAQPNTGQGEFAGDGDVEELFETHVLGNEWCRVRLSNEFGNQPIHVEIIAISLIPNNALYYFSSRGGRSTRDENMTEEIWEQKEIDISAGIAYGSDIFDITCKPNQTAVTAMSHTPPAPHTHTHSVFVLQSTCLFCYGDA